MNAELMSLCLSGRRTEQAGSNRRHVADPDEALSGMMTAVLWQAVKDYLWLLAHGMISESAPFALSAAGLAFGTTVAANGTVNRTNGQTGDRASGGAMGMRELLWVLAGHHLAVICEFTNFDEECIRGRLTALHKQYRAHEEDVRAFILRMT